MKKLTFLLFFLFLGSTAAYAESLSMVTYYPAPFGAYDRLRLVPRTAISPPCLEGLMFYDKDAHQVKICGETGTFNGFGGGWTEGTNKLYTTNYTNQNLLVGIGTNTPNFKLTIDAGNTTGGYVKDGGIYAQGTIDSGIDLSNVSPAADMASFIWYPKKAAIRAGAVDDDPTNWYLPDNASNTGADNPLRFSDNTGEALPKLESWNNGNVGKYSIAMGRNTKALGESSIALGRYSVAKGAASIALGDTALSSGFYSTAIGDDAYAQGNYSTAIGKRVRAQAKSSFVVGACGTANGNKTQWIANDPIFVIGNGKLSEDAKVGDTTYEEQCDDGLSNALTVFKNGSLSLQGTKDTHTLVTLMQGSDTSNNGDTSVRLGIGTTAPEWPLTMINPAASRQGGGIFFEGDDWDGPVNGPPGAPGPSNNVKLPTTTANRNYFIYYPRKSAIRAGQNKGNYDLLNTDFSGTTSTDLRWLDTIDDINDATYSTIGDDSIGMGYGAYAPGFSSIALGSSSQARDKWGTAIGFAAEAWGKYANALGHFTIAKGEYSYALGYGMIVDGVSSVGISLYSPRGPGCPDAWPSGGCPADVTGNPAPTTPQVANGLPVDIGPRVKLSQDYTMAIMGGKVGVDTVAPTQKLDVNGAIRVQTTSSPGTCDSSKAGVIYFNGSHFMGCIGSEPWKQLDN